MQLLGCSYWSSWIVWDSTISEKPLPFGFSVTFCWRFQRWLQKITRFQTIPHPKTHSERSGFCFFRHHKPSGLFASLLRSKSHGFFRCFFPPFRCSCVGTFSARPAWEIGWSAARGRAPCVPSVVPWCDKLFSDGGIQGTQMENFMLHDLRWEYINWYHSEASKLFQTSLTNKTWNRLGPDFGRPAKPVSFSFWSRTVRGVFRIKW